MNAPTTPFCPELPSHAYYLPAGTSHRAHVKVNDEGAEVYFMPVLSFTGFDGIRRTCGIANDVSDLPDFSSDGSRQCFVWGYANLEDALAVVRAINNRIEE